MVDASGEASRGSDETSAFEDDASSRLDRLLAAIEADSDGSAWHDVVDPDTEFAKVRTGALVSRPCDLETTEISKLLSGGRGLNEALYLIESFAPFAPFAPFARLAGQSLEGLPNPDQVAVIRSFSTNANMKPVIIGSDDTATDWRKAAVLDPGYMANGVELDG